MAGDWIKVELVTPDKPEIHRMAGILEISAEQVLGGLIRIWIWADQQSLTGNALSVTEKTLNRISGVTDIAGAMRDVGWLHGKDGVFTLPHFDRHNGQTAKKRALTNKRVETHRKRESNAASVTSALPEKRRKEVQTPLVNKLTGFDRFWPAYPRKVAKAAAEKAWANHANGNIDAIMAALETAKQSAQWQKDGGQYIPHPATWLNGKRWNDQHPTTESLGYDPAILAKLRQQYGPRVRPAEDGRFYDPDMQQRFTPAGEKMLAI